MVRLTEEQKQFYEKNGYILLKNVLSESELDTLDKEYQNLFNRYNLKKAESSWVGSDENDRSVSDTDTTVKGIHNLQMHSAVFSRYLHNVNLLDAVQDIIGSENIMLHHTKAHFKPPEKGAAYPMHQDYLYFPFKKDSMVAAFLHLDDSSPENGGLFVYPGSHKLGPLEDFGSGQFHCVDQEKFPLANATPVIAKRGDIVIFSYLLIHGSSLNTSTRNRRMLLAQLADANDEPIGGLNPQPGYGWMLRGTRYNLSVQISKRHDILAKN